MDVSALVHDGRSFLSAEAENVRRFDVPWRRRLWLYRNGFLSSRDVVWELSPDTVGGYLSDRQVGATGRIDEPYAVALKNKRLFQAVVSGTHGHLLPAVYGVARQGRIVGDARGGGVVDDVEAPRVRSVEDLVALLEDEPVVAKPAVGDNGSAVRVLASRDGQLLVDGRPVSRSAFEAVLATPWDLLLVEHVSQADYAAAVYPDATNSLRILTMVDPDTGEPFVAVAAHRFGTAASGAVDNWSAGGISARVDPDSGELGPAVASLAREADAGRWMATHPDTGTAIEGRVVPGWATVRETVLDLAAEYGGLWPYVGWDVVVTDDAGAVVVLEGSRKSADEDLQAHRPLLAGDRTRRFYEHHGIV